MFHMTGTETAAPEYVAFIEMCLKKNTAVLCVPHGRALKDFEYLCDKPKNAHILSLQHHVSVSPVIIIRVCYNERTFTTQIKQSRYRPGVSQRVPGS